MKNFVLTIVIFFIISALNAQNKTDIHYNILDNAFKGLKPDSKVDYLINELEDFSILFPNAIQEDEVLYRLSLLYSSNGQIHLQFKSLIKLNILHGNSPLRARSLQIIDSLITFTTDFNLSDKDEKILQQLSNHPAQQDYRLAFLDYISFLYSLDLRNFDQFVLQEIAQYKKLFFSSEMDMDAIVFWEAKIFQSGENFAAAIINFNKVYKLYDQSKFVPEALIELARLNRDYSKDIDKARDYLLELINQYPHSLNTGDAQFELAKLYDLNYQDIDEALTNYQLLVSAFPENQNFTASLTRIAAIYEQKKNYVESVTNYKRIVENNGDEKSSLRALKNIIRLYQEKLEDYELSAKTMILFAQTFPKNEQSVKYLLSAGKIYTEKLKNGKKAKEVFEIIIKQFPESSEAEKAKDLKNSISEIRE